MCSLGGRLRAEGGVELDREVGEAQRGEGAAEPRERAVRAAELRGRRRGGENCAQNCAAANCAAEIAPSIARAPAAGSSRGPSASRGSARASRDSACRTNPRRADGRRATCRRAKLRHAGQRLDIKITLAPISSRAAPPSTPVLLVGGRMSSCPAKTPRVTASWRDSCPRFSCFR